MKPALIRRLASSLVLVSLAGCIATVDDAAPADDAGLVSAPLGAACSFARGSRTSVWTTRPTFSAVTNPAGLVNQQNALNWLVLHIANLSLPQGNGNLVAWNDATLGNARVAYLLTDNLWAQHALMPYDSLGLWSTIRSSLSRNGFYGNGLHDALFHDVGATAHQPLDTDPVHGRLLGTCGASDGIDTQVRVPTMGVSASWTNGQTSQFIDSAVYEAMDQLWSGQRAAARDRMLALVARNGADDRMFWDSSRRMLVDVANRADYDRGVFTAASFKLGLVLYALRALGLSIAAVPDMQRRLGEAQLANGGVAHGVTYDSSNRVRTRSGATGEATSIAILAHTINPVP